MRIGIITFHFASNQGAALQCYALQTYLKKLGHIVEVIDYRPSYHATKYSAWKNPFIVANSNWRRNPYLATPKRFYVSFRGFLRGTVSSIKQTDAIRYKIFGEFTNKYLNQTKRFKTIRQLQNDPPSDDLYISGSDQVWNSDFLDYRFDPAYFMKFGGPNIKRITYAVSLKENYTEKELMELKELCSDIDSICIRESHPAFEKCVGKPVTIGVDPTLLLDGSDYNALESERLFDEPYVFVYGFENAEGIKESVGKISKERRIKVINGSPNRIRNLDADKNVFDYGPSDFLSYIKYADFVITNSFHGTAFSIIYKKDFIVVPHSSRGKRMKELLGKLGLSERLWPVSDNSLERPIDYNSVEERMSTLRAVSMEYLQESLKA